MTQPLFRDPTLQARFEREGFLVLPLLGDAELERLDAFYRSHDRGDAPSLPLHYTLDHPDTDYVRSVMSELVEVMGRALRPHVIDLQVITASFVVKETGPLSVTPLHQDWTFVDETRFRSATVWTPLVDVDAGNGALGVIHGSHRFFGTQPRSSPAPQCESLIDRHGLKLFAYMDVQPLRAGEALVFDNALIHGAPPNLTERSRVAAGISFTRAGAQLQHSYLLPGTDPPELETYAIDREFFVRYGNDALSKCFAAGKAPEGVSALGRQLRHFEPPGEEALLELVHAHPRNRYREELVDMMKPLAEYFGVKL